MAEVSTSPADVKLLPDANAPAPAAPPSREITPSTAPPRQLSELPKDELAHLAEEYGLDPTRYRTSQHLVAAIHAHRQMIAALDRDAMLDVVKWGRRPVTYNASKEQIAQEIARIRSMRFAGLSQRGLVVLARVRGLDVSDNEEIPRLVKKLKKREGFFTRINRKRRAMLGSIVSNIIGDSGSSDTYQFLPPGPGESGSSAAPRPASIKEEIEESGLIG